MNSPKPIYGHVPSQILPPAFADAHVPEPEPVPEPKPKRAGWPKGKPRNPAVQTVSDVAPRPPTASGTCDGCGKPAGELALGMVHELVRIARDRLIESGADVRDDVLYLAARVDGYCSIGCWKQNGATDEQAKKLGGT